MFDKVSKVPVTIADTRNIVDIKIKKNTLILLYDKVAHFSDESVSLSEHKTITLSFPKKLKSFSVQIDEEDNMYIGVKYKPPFSLFGWKLTKEEDDIIPTPTKNI